MDDDHDNDESSSSTATATSTENESQSDDPATTTHDTSYDPPVVAASIEILFEVAQTYRQPPDDDSDDEGIETTETNLGVAMFEGYLHGKGPTRWKIAMVREAYEF